MPKIPFWIFIILAVLLFMGVRVDIMDIDASQYAEMSREMLQKGDFLHVFDRGKDYLDKPPFLFWVSSLSMKLFGINNFAYKLPSILFAFLAIYATYRLARLLYNEHTGRAAALILGCSQGMFLMTNDVRTDTILMSWVVIAIWQLKEWDVSKKARHLFAGCAAIAFGMMTKGPIAFLVPIFCFGSDWALKREWRKFFNPWILPGILLIGLLLVPMSIGLYQQFDLHPEKLIDGKHGVSGLRFFYWSQSFGRITGESPWVNGAGFDFLLSNMLWSFLPWIFLFLPALVVNIIELFKQRFRLQPSQEWISTGGFILAYIALGSSRYQLPHYIFVVFPLASIMTAKLLKDFYEGKYHKLYKALKPFQITTTFLLLVAALLTFAVVFKGSKLNYVAWAIGFIAWAFLIIRKVKARIFWTSVAAIMIGNVFITNHFYHTLLKYQLGTNLGRLIKQYHLPGRRIYIFKVDDPLNSVHFYSGQVLPKRDTFPPVQKGDYMITMDREFPAIKAKGFDYEIIKDEVFFKVSELTPEFLNPATRRKALKTAYLVKIK